jgi:lipopolysaccharide assembly outer membrane protein LptD (OstA)
MLRRVFFGCQLLAAITILLGSWMASAQSADPLSKIGMFGPPVRIDRTDRVFVHADRLTHDTTSGRITLQGNVRLSCKGYELVADQVIYDQTLDKLVAAGNARLTDPNLTITKADRIEVKNELGLGDALLETLRRADFQVDR